MIFRDMNTLYLLGLYYGCWISQNVVRSINEGELLITDEGDDENTLTTLLFNFERWRFESEHQPQFKKYCAWLKKHLIKQHPCIITVFLHDDDDDDRSEEYDHIMPAVGIEYKGLDDEYDPNDVLLLYNLFDLKLLKRQLSENDMIKTRDTCKSPTETGGCIPRQITYGYAILGIKDEQQATVPVRLNVNIPNEPNVSIGEKPVMMQGTVTIYDLVPGRDYALLRYNSYKNVPTSGDSQTFLKSNYHRSYEFKANNSTYTYVDPEEIPSKSSTYYRCVPISAKTD